DQVGTAPDDAWLLAEFAGELQESDVAALPLLSAAALRRRDPEARLRYLWDLTRQANYLPGDVELPLVRRFWQVYRANIRAAESYRPAGGVERIVLFGAAESGTQRGPAWRRADPTRGWQQLAPRPVEAQAIPGNPER